MNRAIEHEKAEGRTDSARVCVSQTAGPNATTVRLSEMARGLSVKRNNAITAALSGGGLAIVVARLYGLGDWNRASLAAGLGVAAGLLYANAFEYFLHRFLLHWSTGFLAQRHALHHNSAGAPNEARFVNFATSPWVVLFVFLLNAPPVFAAGGLFGGAAACGMFAGFTCYFITYEEVHWRIHFRGWLPPWLRFARRHHMLHHRGFEGRNNVFLPVCDWIFERQEWTRGKLSTRQ